MYAFVMQDEQPEAQSAPVGQNKQEKEGRRFTNAFQRVPDHEWKAIQHMAESGVDYKEIGEQFGVTQHCIRKRATKQRWATPMRVSKARKGELAVNDPASLVAALWRDRGEQSREATYQGARKALDRFFAMAPVPQSFAEAATAHKLMQAAIDPNGESSSTRNVNLQILSSQGFQPTPVVDV